MKLLTTSAAALAAFSIGIGSATAAMTVGTFDKAFVTGATQSNLAEIAAGKIALAKSSSTTVKTLGKQFIDDHTKANAMLAKVAHAQGLTMPMTPNKMQMATAAALKKLAGTSFDTMWLKTQETGHEKTVALFKSEISSGKNSALVAFATMNLPVVEGHLTKLTVAATKPDDAMSAPKGSMPMSASSPDGMMMASPGAMMASPSAMMSPGPNSSPM